MKVLHGISVGRGIAIAKAFVLEPEGKSCPLRQSLSEPELNRDIRKFQDAIKKTEEALRKSRARVETKLGKGHSAIFDAHLTILRDPLLVDATIEAARKDRVNVAFAFYNTMHKLSDTVAALGDQYLRERTNDIEDVGWQVLHHLTGGERRALKALKEPGIVLAEDLSPSETADMPRESVAGFATIGGSRTSHTAIVAQALELPAVVGVGALRDVSLGDGEVILDGEDGLLILEPDLATLSKYRRMQRLMTQRREDLRSLVQLPAETPDGRRVRLLANVELPIEVAAARNGGAEGIGLLRTEFQFLSRETLPTEEEQYQWYRRIVAEMAPQLVVIRTLDLGGDKMSSLYKDFTEMNPFLGLRGIRLTLANREIFRTQLRAILRASVHGKVEIMFPLISSLDEYRQAMSCVEEARAELRSEKVKFDPETPVGVMIETPAAALIADQLAKEARFFSIGSNDLIQYAIAVDRANRSTSYLYEPLHPAILRLIRTVIDAAHGSNVEVTVCGEIAADPMAGALLLGLGLDVFSVSPVSLAETKRIIRAVPYALAREVAAEALALPTAQAVKGLVRGKLGGRLLVPS